MRDPLRALKAYIDLNLEFAIKKKQMLSMFLREYRLPFIQPLRKNFLRDQQKIIRDILKSGMKKGIFRKVDTKENVNMIFACIRGAILLKHVYGEGDVKKMNKTLFKHITKGLIREQS